MSTQVATPPTATGTPSPRRSPVPGGRRPAPWTVVAAREIVVRLTNKAFIVSTLLMLAILGASIGLQGYLATRDQVMKVVVTDTAAKGIAERVGALARAEDSHNVVRVSQAADDAAAKERVRTDDADVYLARSGDGWELLSHKEPSAQLRRYTQEVVQQETLARNAAAAGTTPQALMKGAEVKATALDSATADREGLATVVALLFSILFMLSSMTFGMQIANSIVEEKASRVVEIIVAAIPVRQLLAGKVVGNTVMALGQIVLFVAVGLVGVSFTPFKTMLPAIASASGWYVVFFLAGFLALACLWALAGALATRQEDLQATTAPMTGILMVSYLAGFTASGSAMTVLSYVPIVSTALMPVRLLKGDAQWWEAALSLAITLGFAVVAVLFSERLYRRSLLQTQGRLTLKQAMALQD